MKNTKYLIIALSFLSAHSSDTTSEDTKTKDEKINIEVESTLYGSDGNVIALGNKKTKKIAFIKLSKKSASNSYNLIESFVRVYENEDIVGLVLIEKNYSTDMFISDLILDIRTKKPVVGYILSSSQSAAYDIISTTNYIVSASSANIGGIGVIYRNSGFKKHEDPYNIINIKTKEPSEREQALSIQQSYDEFCNSVAERRSLNLNEKDTWANGQIFTSNQALSLGLIDKIGSFNDCINVINEMLTTKGESNESANFEIIDYTPVNEDKKLLKKDDGNGE